jgi:hypothetical protein
MDKNILLNKIWSGLVTQYNVPKEKADKLRNDLETIPKEKVDSLLAKCQRAGPMKTVSLILDFIKENCPYCTEEWLTTP